MAFTPVPQGVRVDQVAPDATGAAAGVKAGDIITAVNGTPVHTLADFTGGPVHALGEGQTVRYAVLREGKPQTLSALARSKPTEKPDGAVTVEYGAVAFGGGLLRTLVDKPVNAVGKLPAVLFLQGYPCDSYIDISAIHPYRRLVDRFAQAGFVTMRVDKPGVGESAGGKPCEEIDFHTEAAAFAAALKALKARPDVDPNAVFLYGHSLGGVAAPMIAKAGGVRGVAVYGILPTPWFEYYLTMSRVQGANSGGSLLEHEQSMRLLHPALYALLEEHKTPAEVVAARPEVGPVLKQMYQWDGGRKLYGRDISVYWDLNTINQPELWAGFHGPVLAQFGTADIEVMNEEGPREIARIANQAVPGSGTFCSYPGVDHSYAQMKSMDGEYLAERRPDYAQTVFANYDAHPVEDAIAWMQSVLTSSVFQSASGGACGAG